MSSTSAIVLVRSLGQKRQSIFVECAIYLDMEHQMPCLVRYTYGNI